MGDAHHESLPLGHHTSSFRGPVGSRCGPGRMGRSGLKHTRAAACPLLQRLEKPRGRRRGRMMIGTGEPAPNADMGQAQACMAREHYLDLY